MSEASTEKYQEELAPVRRALAAGEYAEAQRRLNAVRSVHPEAVEPLQLDAELALCQGALDDAQLLAEELQARCGATTATLTLRADIATAKGEFADAAELYQQALANQPESASLPDKLAALALQRGEPEEAIAWSKRALTQSPNHPLYLAHYAEGLLTAERMEEAIAAAEQSLMAQATLTEGWQAMLHIAAAMGNPEQEAQLLALARQHLPDEPKIAVLEAASMLKRGEEAAAATKLDEILAAHPACIEAYHLYCQLHRRRDAHGEMLLLAERALNYAPYNLQTSRLIGYALMQLQRYEEAIPWLHRVVERLPHDVESYAALADLLRIIGEWNASREMLEQWLSHGPDHHLIRSSLGLTLVDLEQNEEALRHLERAIELAPRVANAYVSRAILLANMGKIAEARRAYEETIERFPTLTQAYYNYASLRKFSADEPIIARMEALLASGELAATREEELSFALFRVLESAKEYDRAFGYLERATRLHRQHHPWDITQAYREFQALHTAAPHLVEELRNCGVSDATPIFIVGMPRSGTTLLETILSAHPDVHAAGELIYLDTLVHDHATLKEMSYPDSLNIITCEETREMAQHYLQRLRNHSATAKRITDKLPHNFYYLGLIATLFPKATLIHCRRDPVDTCFSCFKMRFTRGHPYSYDLADLGHYYRYYEQLMEHWQQLLPGRILDVQYEKLVEDPEQQIRRLLEFAGLEWNPACLNFHQSERTVQTASLAQVRQPLYKRSRPFWMNYSRHLGPLFAALGINPPAEDEGKD